MRHHYGLPIRFCLLLLLNVAIVLLLDYFVLGPGEFGLLGIQNIRNAAYFYLAIAGVMTLLEEWLWEKLRGPEIE